MSKILDRLLISLKIKRNYYHNDGYFYIKENIYFYDYFWLRWDNDILLLISKRSNLKYKIHKEDSPAITYSDGSVEWFFEGKVHRENGPACEYYNGDKIWYYHGKLHREDGPAIERSNGHKKWFVHGEHISCKDNKEFLKIMKMRSFL